MYYAVLWYENNPHSTRHVVAGWSIHESIERAAQIEEIHIPNTFRGRIYMVEVKIPDFDKELFKAIIKQGYYFTEEQEPTWMIGSGSPTSKIA